MQINVYVEFHIAISYTSSSNLLTLIMYFYQSHELITCMTIAMLYSLLSCFKNLPVCFNHILCKTARMRSYPLNLLLLIRRAQNAASDNIPFYAQFILL